MKEVKLCLCVAIRRTNKSERGMKEKDDDDDVQTGLE